MATVSLFNDKVSGGIMAESLTRYRSSVQRSPIIAGVFHRAGLIEKWGRGASEAGDGVSESELPSPPVLNKAARCSSTSAIPSTLTSVANPPRLYSPRARERLPNQLVALGRSRITM